MPSSESVCYKPLFNEAFLFGDCMLFIGVQLKDLAAFNSILDGEALHNWRFILAASQGIISTEDSINSINKLFIDPVVHCSLVGNCQRVMTPCVPPPARQHVASYKNPQGDSTLLVPADAEQKDQVSILTKDDSIKMLPQEQSREPDLIEALSFPCSSSPILPGSSESTSYLVAVQSSQENNQTPELSEQESPLSKAFKSDCHQPEKYQMHSTPLRSKLLSIPAPVLTPIALLEKETKDNREKVDPQPSTSKAKPETNHLRRHLASKQMKVNIVNRECLLFHLSLSVF